MLQNKHDNIDSTTFSMPLKLLSVVYLATILYVTESSKYFEMRPHVIIAYDCFFMQF